MQVHMPLCPWIKTGPKPLVFVLAYGILYHYKGNEIWGTLRGLKLRKPTGIQKPREFNKYHIYKSSHV